MIQIRRSVFETNSSSTHSVCVAHTEYKAWIPKTVTFEPGDFGWDYGVFDDWPSKADYLFSALLGLFSDNEIAEYTEKIKAILAKNGVSCEFVFPQKYEYSGKEYWDFDGIDHVADGDLRKFVEDTTSSEDALMSFLFNDDSYVETGNDNDDTIPSDSVDYPATVYFKGN